MEYLANTTNLNTLQDPFFLILILYSIECFVFLIYDIATNLFRILFIFSTPCPHLRICYSLLLWEPWDFFGRNDAKAETPVLWPPYAKSWLIGKDSDAGRDWGQKEKGTTEDEMAGWHHWLDGRESEWTPGVGDGQGGLACGDSWGHKESDTTERLIWSDYSEKNKDIHIFAVY